MSEQNSSALLTINYRVAHTPTSFSKGDCSKRRCLFGHLWSLLPGETACLGTAFRHGVCQEAASGDPATQATLPRAWLEMTDGESFCRTLSTQMSDRGPPSHRAWLPDHGLLSWRRSAGAAGGCISQVNWRCHSQGGQDGWLTPPAEHREQLLAQQKMLVEESWSLALQNTIFTHWCFQVTSRYRQVSISRPDGWLHRGDEKEFGKAGS